MYTTGYRGTDWINVAYDRYVQMVILRECDSDLSGFMKLEEYLDSASND
jgi:hypothetical protein